MSGLLYFFVMICYETAKLRRDLEFLVLGFSYKNMNSRNGAEIFVARMTAPALPLSVHDSEVVQCGTGSHGNGGVYSKCALRTM